MVGIMSKKSSIVTHVLRQSGRKRKLGPIIVDFEHGEMDSGAFEDFKVGMAHKFPQEDNGDPELQVVVKSEHLSYSNNADSARKLPKNQSLKTWLVVRNKETNQVRLVETNVVTVGGDVTFPKTINPYLLSEERKRKESEVEAASVQATLNEKDVRWKHLVKEFGAKKGKRLVEQIERQKLDSDVKNEKLKLVLDDIDASKIVLPEKVAPKELTPPCNREAKLQSQVYNLKDIVSDQELNVLEQAASELLETYDTPEKVDEAVRAKIFSEILGDVIKNQLLQFPNPSIVGYCIYVEAIFAYLNLKPFAITRGPRALPSFVPILVATNIFDKFVPGGVASQENSDRAFCYGLITLLLISDYSVELKKLSSAVKKSQFWFKKLILVTGASISTDPLTRSSFVELKLPLSKFDIAKIARKPPRK